MRLYFPSLSVCGCRERAVTRKMEGKHSGQMELELELKAGGNRRGHDVGIRSGTC